MKEDGPVVNFHYGDYFTLLSFIIQNTLRHITETSLKYTKPASSSDDYERVTSFGFVST